MSFTLDHRLSFGKYRGRSIKELIVPDCSIIDLVLSKYLKELCEAYLQGRGKYRIPTPMRIKESDHTRWFRTLGNKKKALVRANLDVVVTDRYLVNKKISVRAEFSDFVRCFLDLDLRAYGLGSKSMYFQVGESSEFSTNSKQLDSCFPAISYLKWLLDTVDNFKLSDSAIEQIFEIKSDALKPDHICFASINKDIVQFNTVLAPIKICDKVIDEVVKLNSAKEVRRYIPNEYSYDVRPVDPWVDAFGDLADDAYWNTE